MRELNIIRRYAEAFAGFAKGPLGLDRFLSEVRCLRDVFRSSPELREFLETLQVTQREKTGFVDRVLGSSFSDQTRFFIAYLLRKGRVEKIADILDYVILFYSHEGDLSAVVTCRTDPGPASLSRIQASLEKKFRKKVHMELVLDDRLMGGVQIMIGNILIDGSVRRRLQEIREKLLTVRVHGYGTQA
jgi:F-type H+-transporting ATPase subunit delta